MNDCKKFVSSMVNISAAIQLIYGIKTIICDFPVLKLLTPIKTFTSKNSAKFTDSIKNKLSLLPTNRATKLKSLSLASRSSLELFDTLAYWVYLQGILGLVLSKLLKNILQLVIQAGARYLKRGEDVQASFLQVWVKQRCYSLGVSAVFSQL